MSCLPASRAGAGLPVNSPAAILTDVGQFPTGMVPLYLVSAGDSPRSSGLDKEQVRLLAGTPQQWPPILVYRPTMSVIDGAHRLEAARQRGDREIEVSYFDGDEDAAFVLAVRSNVTNGLPLTLADRTAAAARILGSYPDWSDRAIARATGLAAATVRGIRRRRAGDFAQPSTRIGSDGRMRPIDIADRRRLAGYLIAKNPAASLREIAREAGISPATVQDVRRQLAGGHDEVTPKQPAAGPGTHHVPGHGEHGAASGDLAIPPPGPLAAFQRDRPVNAEMAEHPLHRCGGVDGLSRQPATAYHHLGDGGGARDRSYLDILRR